jgi:hypothetical protein
MRRPVAHRVFKQRPFQFIPKDLAAKCRKLIESYHAMYGFVGLPDMLWLSDARDLIECNNELTKLFKKASKSRGAKRANESFLLIATTIVSVEVLARDFGSWGMRFPAAKIEAEEVLSELPSQRRTWLMDLYLYPPVGAGSQFADALSYRPQRPSEECCRYASDCDNGHRVNRDRGHSDDASGRDKCRELQARHQITAARARRNVGQYRAATLLLLGGARRASYLCL